MKSLSESLFDNNITKGYTFGDLFKIDEQSSRWKHYPLDKQFSVQRIKAAVKRINKNVDFGTDKNEIIFKGLCEIICDLDLNADSDKMWLRNTLDLRLYCFFQYSKSIPKSITVHFINNGKYILDKGINISDNSFVNVIQINIGPDLALVFRRK